MKEFASDDEYVSEEDFEDKKGLQIRSKMESFLDSRYFVAVLVILVGVVSFSLGRIFEIQNAKEPVKIYSGSMVEGLPEVRGASTEGGIEGSPEKTSVVVEVQTTEKTEGAGSILVASKNGTKYHYPWCAGAKQISEKNKITFSSVEEARAKGYTPAANCKDLK